jgi:serine O-acetyltransferase
MLNPPAFLCYLLAMGWFSDYTSDVRRFADFDIRPPGSVVKSKALWALLQYRLAHQYSNRPMARPFFFAWRMAIESLTGISISSRAEIGPGCYIGHFGGIIIGNDVVIGARCVISHGVTLGVSKGGSPTIGDDCGIAPGAIVLGRITVGNGAHIGPNAVVSENIPDGAMVRAAPIVVRPARTQTTPRALVDET